MSMQILATCSFKNAIVMLGVHGLLYVLTPVRSVAKWLIGGLFTVTQVIVGTLVDSERLRSHQRGPFYKLRTVETLVSTIADWLKCLDTNNLKQCRR